ncbi:MAG: ASKHA domain-containing protein [Thermoleophilia bacterium]|nr:ASKHA domain-containing protein [Thermoleophilia bacterium]
MTQRYTLTFQPGDVKVPDVPRGESVLRAAMQANIHINASCGGAGSCGKCRIKLLSGEVDSDRSAKIDDDEWSDGTRLACNTRVSSDVAVFVPEASRMGNAAVLERELRGERKGRLLTPAELESLVTGWTLDPVVKKLCMQLTPPSDGDNLNDLARFRKALKDQFGLSSVSVDSIWIRNMPSVLREQDWLVTATVVDTAYGYKAIDLEPGSHCEQDYSVVLDIGTTTVWGQLLDLTCGATLAQASAYNKQISFGEDVITRIVHSQRPGGREQLQQAIVDTVNEIIDELVESTRVDREQITHMVAAGNTTMTCLLVGIDPKYLRMTPYVPPADFIPPVRAVNLGEGLKVGRHVHVYTFPSVASYVGGDIVSGIVGSGIFETEKITLYIDIGTNGEVVIGNREWLIATSCSAGPAFEGGGVRHGMRATDGAVETVRIDPQTLEPTILTISNRPAIGICGSGIIDAVAELLKVGAISQNGRFNTDLDTWRIRETDGANEYVLVEAEYSGLGEDIVINEADIDNLVRAKAAIFAGIMTLLESVALDWADLEQIYVAGGFGKYLRIEEAQAIGLFPEVDVDSFTFVGNGSLLGARLVSFSKDMLKSAEQVALMMTNVELSDNQLFMDRYMAAMFLPHTDMSYFPAMDQVLSGLAAGGR